MPQKKYDRARVRAQQAIDKHYKNMGVKKSNKAVLLERNTPLLNTTHATNSHMKEQIEGHQFVKCAPEPKQTRYLMTYQDPRKTLESHGQNQIISSQELSHALSRNHSNQHHTVNRTQDRSIEKENNETTKKQYIIDFSTFNRQQLESQMIKLMKQVELITSYELPIYLISVKSKSLL